MKKAFFCGVLFLVVSALPFCEEFDQNGDGRTDKWVETDERMRLVFREDSNYDGRVDSIITYEKNEEVLSEFYDYNYDGEMDDFYYYSGGVLSRHELDSNYDTQIDIWIFLHKGIYVKLYEQDTDFDGIPDIRKEYGP